MASALDSEMRLLAQSAVQANKDHQYALKVYTERLEAELETVDKLLTAAEVSDNEDELEVNAGGTVVVPGSVKPTGPVVVGDLLAKDSPFYEDAIRRQRYIESIAIHPMKLPDFEALTDGVRSENYRIHALEAQLRGQQPFVEVDDYPPGHFEINKVGINWERVAMKVSSSSGSSNVQRSAKECEIRWLGERHPQFNHTQWTQSEITRVKELVADTAEGQVDWTDIAAELGTRRTPIDCMRHAIVRKSHVWTPDSDDRLREAVHMYGVDSWALVARYVSEDSTATQCQSRYTRTLDPNIRRGAWTSEEDDQLRRAVAIFGHSWIEVAMYIPGRNNEQCRDRYQDTVNPSVSRSKWTEEQDMVLLQAVEQATELKWKDISAVVGQGRTDNQCRARYGVLMKRRQKGGTVSSTPSSSQLPTPAARRSPSHHSQSPHPPVTALEEAASTQAIKPRPKPRPRRKKATRPPADGIAASIDGVSAQSILLEGHAMSTGEAHGDPVEGELGSRPRQVARRITKRNLHVLDRESPQPKRKRTKTGNELVDSTPGAGLSTPAEPQNSSKVPVEGETRGEGSEISEEVHGSSSQSPKTKEKSMRNLRTGRRKRAAIAQPQHTLSEIPEIPQPTVDLQMAPHAVDTPPQKVRRGKKINAPHREPTRRQPSRAAARHASAQKVSNTQTVAPSLPPATASATRAPENDEDPLGSDLSSLSAPT